MGRVSVRPFEARDVQACSEIFAARHRGDRQRLPMLTQGLESAEAAAEVLAQRANNPRVDGVVAERDGAVAGFMFGEEMLFPPDHFASQYIPPQSADIGVDSHGVVAGEDMLDVYRAMYSQLAGNWVRRGLFTHRVHIVPNADVQEVWLTLGFGRQLTAATRETAAPVAATGYDGIEVHQAGAEDIDVVMSLADSLNRHHLQSPIFWPILPAPQPAARDFNLGHLGDPATNPYFVAYRDGQPIAMQTFIKPGFIPPVVEQDGNLYLYEGVVDDSARSGGVGAALLDHTMAWLREHGVRLCTLHFASMNPHGAPFWLKHGFVPVEHEMERRIDDRVAWARG